MGKFYETKLRTDITVSKICTVHYFEYSKDYSYYGESHNFWELVYVDKGEITAVADEEKHILKRGDVIFHKPNEWHTLYANGEVAPNLVIVTFSSVSPAMKFFENKILKMGQNERRIISEIINEYLGAFSTPIDDTFTTSLTRKKNQLFGSEQMIKILLESLLISMVRGNDGVQKSLTHYNSLNFNLNLAIGYIRENLSENLSVEQLAKYVGISKSSLATMFKENFGCGISEYIIKIRIETAKNYIRENNYNFSQIANMLGYSSVHYFSRQFKIVSGMSPSEYSKSVKALVEKAKSADR